MGLRISTNIAAISAQRHLGAQSVDQAKTFSRLASGNRITSAGDDAAGLSISENLKAQVRSMRQAERNANDGISFVQVAEGGLSEVGNILVRLRELSVQASSDTIGDRERGFIDKEYQSLKAEIDRIANSTNFNGIDLLGGTAASINFQVGIGTSSNDSIAVSFGGVSSSGLGLNSIAVGGSTSTNATAAITALDTALTTVSTSRASFGAASNRLSIAVSTSQTIRTNLEAANSSIRDVDVAEETSLLARSQVLLQAGTSVLAQANGAPQLALSLLR